MTVLVPVEFDPVDHALEQLPRHEARHDRKDLLAAHFGSGLNAFGCDPQPETAKRSQFHFVSYAANSLQTGAVGGRINNVNARRRHRMTHRTYRDESHRRRLTSHNCAMHMAHAQ